jgi:hypothetical protein
MGRKSKYDQLVESIGKRLRAMAPENCETIEEALRNDQTLADMGLAAPSSAEDYSYCPDCGHVCWHGVCRACE